MTRVCTSAAAGMHFCQVEACSFGSAWESSNMPRSVLSLRVLVQDVPADHVEILGAAKFPLE